MESVVAGVLEKEIVVKKADAPSRAQRLLAINDVLFQTVRPYQKNNYFFDVEKGIPSVASTGYAQLRTSQNANFLYQLINTPNFTDDVLVRCTGSSYPAINSNDMKEIVVKYPSPDEQNKIASFLKIVDSRIEKQQALVDALKLYKRGVLQTIFTKIIPSIDNTNIAIKELFDNIIDKGHEHETVLTIVQGIGTLPRDSIERRISYDKKSVSAYKKVCKNDFILHLRSFEGGLEIANESGIVSPAYTILRAKTDISPEFYYAYFRSYTFINDKLRIAVEGIRDGKSINMSTFWNIAIPYPKIELQKQYGEILSLLTKKIDMEVEYLTSLNNTKQFLLQQMFI